MRAISSNIFFSIHFSLLSFWDFHDLFVGMLDAGSQICEAPLLSFSFSLFIKLDHLYRSVFKFTDSMVLLSRNPGYFHLLTQDFNMYPTCLPLKESRGQESATVLWDVYIISLYISLDKMIPYSHNLIAREAGKFVSQYAQDEENGI